MLAGDAPDVINILPSERLILKEWAKAGYFENMTGKSYLKKHQKIITKKIMLSTAKFIASRYQPTFQGFILTRQNLKN